MGSLAKAWAALGHWSLAHWIITSLGGGALMTLTLEAVTDAPLELTLSLGVLIVCILMVMLKALPALEADKLYKAAKSAALKRQESDRLRYRHQLIKDCRMRLATHDHVADGDFSNWIKKQPEYYQIRPHLLDECVKALDSFGLHIDIVEGGVADGKKRQFIQEIDRLAKGWSVD